MDRVSEELNSDRAKASSETHEWVISRAVQLPQDKNIPARFPILLDESTGFVCEPALLYLHEQYVERNSGGPVENSIVAYAHDLKEWWRYLNEARITWTAARPRDLAEYLGVMDSTISPETGEQYADTTITRRVHTVECFYAWAQEAGLVGNDTPSNGLLKAKLNGTSKGNWYRRLSDALRRRELSPPPVSVLHPTHARTIFEILGPLPSKTKDARQGETPESRSTPACQRHWHSSRDRLAAEISVGVGLRVSEVADLDVRSFASFNTSISPTENYTVDVKGKGSKVRTVNFPGWLVTEILLYIEGERALLGLSSSRLLVNPASSGRFVGRKTNVRTLQRKFNKACIDAGCITKKNIIKFDFDEVTGLLVRTSQQATKALYVFHHLRHTYALLTYYGHKANGNSEPWLYIQAQLGHRNLSTTLKTYLRSAHDFEALISDIYMEAIDAQASPI